MPRIEKDVIGEVKIEDDEYYGIKFCQRELNIQGLKSYVWMDRRRWPA